MPATGGTPLIGSSAARDVTTPSLHCSDSAAPVIHNPSATGNTGMVPVSDGTKWVASTQKPKAITVVNDDYAILTTDEVIVCDKATAMSVTLPSSSGSGDCYYVKNIAAGVVTLNCTGIYDMIDNGSTQNIYQWECLLVCDYNTGYWIIL